MFRGWTLAELAILHRYRKRAHAIAAGNDLIRHANAFLNSATNAILETLELPSGQRYELRRVLEDQFVTMTKNIRDEADEAAEHRSTP